MSIFDIPIAEWTSRQIDALIGLKESLILDFKAELHIETRAQKKELCKDVCAIANSYGGYIIYGIREEELEAVSVNPVIDPTLVERIDNILHDSISPRPNVRPVAIAYGDGHCLALHVERLPDQLHVVSAYEDNRYYRRRETGRYVMSEYEVREAYNEILRRAAEQESRLERYGDRYAFTNITSDVLCLLLVPAGTHEHTLEPTVIDPGATHADQMPTATGRALVRGLDPSSFGWQTDPDVGDELHVYRDGTVAFRTAHYFGHGDEWHPYHVLDRVLATLLLARLLWQGRVYGPATLEARYYTLGDRKPYLRSSFHRLVLPEGSASQRFPVHSALLQCSPERLAQHVMDWLWNAMGQKRCHFFAEEGKLTDQLWEILRTTPY